MLADKSLFLSLLTFTRLINDGVHDRHSDFRDYIQWWCNEGSLTPEFL